MAFLLGHRQVTTLNRYVRPSERAAERVLAAVAVGDEAPVDVAALEVVAAQAAAASEVHLRSAAPTAEIAQAQPARTRGWSGRSIA